MIRNYKFDRYKVVFNGIIQNKSPLIIGGGGDEETDSDILKDKNGKPFIPGTSIAGILRHHLHKHYKEFRNDSKSDLESDLLKSYFGYSKGDNGSGSKIIFSDLYLIKNSAGISIRDGIRIDYKTGIVEDKGKFDFEIVEPGGEFDFNIEIGGNDKDALLKLISTLKRDMQSEIITIGAKTNLGFGKIKLKEDNISFYDLKDKHDILNWIKKEDNKFDVKLPEPYEYQSDSFKIEFDFVIKDSLIVKHYSSNPSGSDSSNIKSKGKNIIPGTSIKGAIRARACRILNTLQIKGRNELFDFLFGNSSNNDKVNNKEYDGSIPSRIKINEVVINQNVEDSIQQRIKIDRFTGGTINGALFDSTPIFAKDCDVTNKLILELMNPVGAEIGLILLVLKDLWTEDLPIGGEKNVGRGIIKGKRALISYQNWSISINDINSLSTENRNKLQGYVDDFNSAEFESHLKVMKSRYDLKEVANG